MGTNLTPSPAVRLEAGSIIKVSDGAGGEKEAKVAARYEVYDLADAAILQARADGSVFGDENTVVKVGDEYIVYTQLFATNEATMRLLCGGPTDLVTNEDGSPKKGEPSVASAFNYGNDLNAKRSVRGKHEETTKGPSRTINATVAGLMKLGWTKEEAEAAAKAKLPTA
jgi:hypothetical protein